MAGTRKLAAILVADVVGYSRLAGADEERTLARLRSLRSDLIDPTIAVHNGRLVKRTGDGAVVEFRSVVEAVRSAMEVQSGLAERNAGLSPETRIEVRVAFTSATWSRRATAISWATALTSPPASKAFASPARYRCDSMRVTLHGYVAFLTRRNVGEADPPMSSDIAWKRLSFGPLAHP